MMIRVFRNLDGVVWENRIHEQMTTALVKAGNRHGLRLGVTDVTVDHYGYLDEVVSERNKNQRNDRIFRAHLDEHPDDIYMLYKYGDFLRRHTGRWSESLAMLRRAFDQMMDLAPAHRTEIPYAGEIAALAALEYRRAGDDATAEYIVQTALREFVCTPNLHYLAAGLATLNGRSDEAIGHYRRCLAFRDQVLVVPIQEGITSHVSITGMAQCYLQKGQRERARRLLAQSIRLAPGYEVSTLLLSRVHLDHGDPRAALTCLTEFLERYPDSPGVCQQAALFMKELGYTLEARAMAQRAIDLLESQSLDFEANQVRKAVFAQA
jgi:Tfp pilus assembly protein PilF